MSACIGFTKCRIQFISNDRQYDFDYSERSLVELREHELANITLRALDIENDSEV